MFLLISGTGASGAGMDEYLQDCSHSCLHFVCKKAAPYRPLINQLVFDVSIVVPSALLSGQFSDQDGDILQNLVRIFKVFWSK